MQGQILVTAEELRNTATAFSQKGNNVKNLLDKMMTDVTASTSYWEGDAAQGYVQKFRGLADDIERINKMIQEHVTDLGEMSGIYDTVEQQNLDDIQTLSSDIII